ncbi:MAG: N4-gp56 family major capsid protein, partial [Clostridia bacterium]|nr:N4-gp56 family major capsid protein [Clostridia bacterium]
MSNHVNATTDVSPNDLSAEMKTFYDLALIDEAGPMLVHDQFGQKRPIPKNGGKTIDFRKFDALPKASAPLTEGVTPDGQRLSVSSVTATVSQYGDYITQSDVLELTALDNTILEATKLLGRQAGLTLDSITRNELLKGTNVNYCPKLSGATETPVTSRADLDDTCKLTVDVVGPVVAKLRAQNAPTINGDYVAVVHPYVAYDLMRDPEWIDAHKYAEPDALFTGELGKISGVRFVGTTEAKVIHGADLASGSRTLMVNGAITANTTKQITFDGGTLAADEIKGRYIVVDGVTYKVAGNTTTKIIVEGDHNLPAIANDTVIYPEGNSTGGAVFCTLVMGQGAYGVTEVEG